MGQDRRGHAGLSGVDRDGLPSKLQGFGVFSEPRCQTGCDPPRYNGGLDPEPPGGWEAVTSEDEKIKARIFLAPFSYITVWVLDPKTLAVLDKQQSFDNQKLAERAHKPALDLSKGDAQKYLLGRIASLIELSVGAAVMQSEIRLPRGEVEVGPIKEVAPERRREIDSYPKRDENPLSRAPRQIEPRRSHARRTRIVH